MKINQNKLPFKPLNITFETKEEVCSFWDLIEGRVTDESRDIGIEISNWLSNNASF